METRTESVLALSGFPPLVKNVPPNWPNVPAPNKLSLLWNYNYHDIYHKFSPFTNYDDNLLSCILSDKQPFVYTYIDESDKGIINQLPSGLKSILSTINITQDSVNDVVRIGKWSISSWGIQFYAAQTLLQRTQPFDETRIYNPLSPILATVQPMTAGLGGRPMRHIEGGLAGLGLGLLDSLTSTFGISLRSGFSTPKSTVGDPALSDYNTGQGKGLIRGNTATTAFNTLKNKWPISDGTSGNSGLGFSGFLNKIADAATQMFGSAKQPSGTKVRADEVSYNLMAVSPRLDVAQTWYPYPDTRINQPRKKTSLLGQINSVTSAVMSLATNPLQLAGQGLSSLFNSTFNNSGRTPFKRQKFISVPGGFLVVNTTNGFIGQSLKGGTPTGYQIQGDKYSDNVYLAPSGVFENSDMMVQFSYYATDQYNYESKFSDTLNQNVKDLSDNLKSVLDAIDNVNTAYSVDKKKFYSKLLSAGNITTLDYISLYAGVPKYKKEPNTYGALAEYNTKESGKKAPPATIDKWGNREKNLKFATSFTSDGLNQISVLTRDKNGKLTIPYDDALHIQYGNWKEYQPYEDDLIAFFFYDVVNKKYIPFRATVKGISEGNTAFWDELRFLGRADQLYSYNGYSRSLTFNFNVVINSINELLPSWKKINYLASVVKPSNYTKSTLSGEVYNRFMVPPMMMLTIGDLYKYQPIVIRNVNVNIPEDAIWETLNQENSEDWNYLNGRIKNPYVKGKYGQLPREVEINVEGALLEKERPQIGGSHYGHAPRKDDWEKYIVNGEATPQAFVVGMTGTDSEYFLPTPNEVHVNMLEIMPAVAPSSNVKPFAPPSSQPTTVADNTATLNETNKRAEELRIGNLRQKAVQLQTGPNALGRAALRR